MNALLFAAMLAFGTQDGLRADIQATSKPATQLYVKTIPSGAEVKVDGKKIGKSDGLFDVAAGEHKLTLSMEDYIPDERLDQSLRGGDHARDGHAQDAIGPADRARLRGRFQ